MFILAEKYFEPIKPGPEPRLIHTIEPPQLGEKRLFVKREVPSPYIMISYHIPETMHEDYYALDLLNSILSEGRSSRLYSSIVEDKQLALQVGSYFSEAFNALYLFRFSSANQRIFTNYVCHTAFYIFHNKSFRYIHAKRNLFCCNKLGNKFYRTIFL